MTSEGRPPRRLRVQPAVPAPRVEALDALLKDVDDLRLALSTDLSLVASAVEAGATDLAVEILEQDRQTLHRFEDRALIALDALAQAPRRRSRLASHAAPAAAAAALVALLAGLMPTAGTTRSPDVSTTTTVAATDSLALLQDLVARGETDEARVASATLHRQLAGVVSRAKTDPLAAQQALLLLSYEQTAIVANGGSEELADVLTRSFELARAIRAALPKLLRTVVPALPMEQAPSQRPSAKPSATPKPTASAKPSSRPSRAAEPTPTASPSSSPTKDSIVPEPPDLNR